MRLTCSMLSMPLLMERGTMPRLSTMKSLSTCREAQKVVVTRITAFALSRAKKWRNPNGLVNVYMANERCTR